MTRALQALTIAVTIIASVIYIAQIVIPAWSVINGIERGE